MQPVNKIVRRRFGLALPVVSSGPCESYELFQCRQGYTGTSKRFESKQESYLFFDEAVGSCRNGMKAGNRGKANKESERKTRDFSRGKK